MIFHYLTIAGIILQFIGAGYVVYGSFQTWRALRSFPDQVTYNSLGDTISTLVKELKGQFFQQSVAFAFVFIGTFLQLYVLLCA